MPTARPSGSARLGAVLSLAVLASAIAACGSATGAPPSSSPGVSPTPSPIATPTPEPTATPEPSTPGQSGVHLDIADDHDVSVVVENVTGYPLRASSGRAGDGMSVRWHEAEVVNVNDSTLRVTWVGLPIDEQIKLVASYDNGPIHLTFEQSAPPANSDATGYDRVLILSFDTPVSAGEVTTAFKQVA
jgi:hypothetical protein